MAQLVRGHLRDIIGRMDLNDALGSTAKINADLAAAIGDLTNTYGINVDCINIDELLHSQEIQKSMNKQLTADRERIAAIAKAEGEAESIRLTNEAQNNTLMATAKAQAEATKTHKLMLIATGLKLFKRGYKIRIKNIFKIYLLMPMKNWPNPQLIWLSCLMNTVINSVKLLF